MAFHKVAQARRLGHILGDRIQTTYSHVAALLDGEVDPHSGAVGLRQPLTSAITTDNGAPFLLLVDFGIVVALVVVTKHGAHALPDSS